MIPLVEHSPTEHRVFTWVLPLSSLRYWRYNEDMRTMDPGYPKPITVWKGVPDSPQGAFVDKANGKCHQSVSAPFPTPGHVCAVAVARNVCVCACVCVSVCVCVFVNVRLGTLKVSGVKVSSMHV